ncbi:MAG: DUF4062 domain-containing protein [Betaproteobacteria bacterium]|nr:DUF4062 domain-containing protein [Betaproteobacteria bacterium]MCX7196110.1 DUF4062 domain-containing protein [Pseudomonadota bacterium]
MKWLSHVFSLALPIYDLKHIRSSLESFIIELGYEPVLFERGDIPFHHDKPLDINCYDAVENAHIFVLIIGGSYGSAASEQRKLPSQSIVISEEDIDKRYQFYNSITVEEYKRARSHDLPIYIFVEKGVSIEYQTYKENRGIPIKYAHVDNVGVFQLLDSIFSESRNNLVKEFDTFSQISSWLRDQWAGLMADYLSRKTTDSALHGLTTQVQTLNQIVEALKSYSEAIVKKVEPDKDKSAHLITQIEKNLAAKIVMNSVLIRYLRIQDIDIEKAVEAVIKSPDIIVFSEKLNLDDERFALLVSIQNEAGRDLMIMRRQLSLLNTYKEIFRAAPPIDLQDMAYLEKDPFVARRLRAEAKKKMA